MPRRLRCYLPGIPSHVIQRGNNRQPCFFSPHDYTIYREILADALHRHGVHLHAYVLMTNHVHLLMTADNPEGISRVMQHTGRCYVTHINRTCQRTGTLWEGRHKSTLIDAERYLFACHRYIELNPLRAGMVSNPADYAWSSYRHYGLGVADDLVTSHPLHVQLHSDPARRQILWRELVSEALDSTVVDEIRHASMRNYPLGDKRFRVEIEATLKRSIGQPERGRPKNRAGSDGALAGNLSLF